MVRIMVLLDQDPSSKKAFKAALATFNQETDVLLLVHIYSSWDYLNDEKNTGKLALYEFESYCTTLKLEHVRAFQVEADDPRKEAVAQVVENKVDVVYIGETAFTGVAGDENLVFWLFSSIKRLLVGTMVSYLVNNSPCPVHVVPLGPDRSQPNSVTI
eukprot:TRINITY_DN19722_c0_g1_i1.p1 TRINITY_DN19722_c0_g1~~TRINITY_DN19722_c0_g1_i1.p1  ORF type:complete len:158 (+),score=40.37 TRINITY_DN19722_c0_g1_i1:186-659(+)